MESSATASSVLTSSHFFYTPKLYFPNFLLSPKTSIKTRLLFSSSRTITYTTSSSSTSSRFVISGDVEAITGTESSTLDPLPKIDKSGRFCSPRAARELALMVLYASCLDGSDPVRLFDKRVDAGKEPGYIFDKASLMEYDHMSFGGPPVTTETAEEADEILRNDQKDSDLEAEVLSAPPKLVYSKLILRFTRKLLVAVVENWDNNVLAIDKVAPLNWKDEPAGRILELSLLHLAMSEIGILGTRHQIVINEAVDLAKRFCDGAAPRIINGCLRTYVQELNINSEDQNLTLKQTAVMVNR